MLQGRTSEQTVKPLLYANDFERLYTYRPAVRSGGYAWWYFDAVSDDGQRGLTAIFFIGSVFSPDYAQRFRRGEEPEATDHLGVNLALYERGRKVAWVMSEYGADALRPVSRGLQIGDSSIQPLGAGSLRLDIREKSAPFLLSLAGIGRPVMGVVELEPEAPPWGASNLGMPGGVPHFWRVAMPRARVKVDFGKLGFSFEGSGYHDLNQGDGRLEDAFSRWSWARFHHDGETRVFYSTRDRQDRHRALLAAGRADLVIPEESSSAAEGPLRRVGWGLSIPSWFSVGDGHTRCVVGRLLERSPFYARYEAELVDGQRTIARGVGEHLDLDRFRSPALPGRWAGPLKRPASLQASGRGGLARCSSGPGGRGGSGARVRPAPGWPGRGRFRARRCRWAHRRIRAPSCRSGGVRGRWRCSRWSRPGAPAG